MFRYIIEASSLLMLWRDAVTGKIYYVPKIPDKTSQFYLEKDLFPKMYWAILFIVGANIISDVVLVFLSSSGMASWLHANCPEYLFYIPIAVQCLYLVDGLCGRLASWVKNYGSVDQKW